VAKSGSSTSGMMRRPNFLIILIDDLRFDE